MRMKILEDLLEGSTSTFKEEKNLVNLLGGNNIKGVRKVGNGERRRSKSRMVEV